MRQPGHRFSALARVHARTLTTRQPAMFTGLVTDIGEIVAVRDAAEGLRRLKVACGYPRASIGEGASIACAGVCLTVVGIGEEGGRIWFAADAAAETPQLATVGHRRVGAMVELQS